MAQNIKAVEALTPEENSVPIAKPGEFDLDKFKAKQAATVANVETLQSPLPVHNMATAKDFVRLHPDDKNYSLVSATFFYSRRFGRAGSRLERSRRRHERGGPLSAVGEIAPPRVELKRPFPTETATGVLLSRAQIMPALRWAGSTVGRL
jgi:hypothetical protein